MKINTLMTLFLIMSNITFSQVIHKFQAYIIKNYNKDGIFLENYKDEFFGFYYNEAPYFHFIIFNNNKAYLYSDYQNAIYDIGIKYNKYIKFNNYFLKYVKYFNNSMNFYKSDSPYFYFYFKNGIFKFINISGHNGRVLFGTIKEKYEFDSFCILVSKGIINKSSKIKITEIYK